MSTSIQKITYGALEEIRFLMTCLGQIAASFRAALLCAHETERLLPDEQLAARGLRRDEIVHQVFQPYFAD